MRTRQRHHVLLAPAREPEIGELVLHRLARLEALEPLERPAVLVERAVELQDVDLLEAVPLPGRKVVRVVRGSHLHDARAELRVDELRIEDHRNHPVDEGMADVLAVQVPVAFVVRVNRHGGVPEHRLRTRRRNHHLAVSVCQRIGKVEHQPFDILFLLDLEVRQHGLRLDVPVDQPGVPVDQPLFVEPHERLTDRPHHVGVHRELGSWPVARGAHLSELLKDPAAGLLLPLPDPLDELLAAEVVACQALPLELPLDDHLRRNAGMVDAGDPKGVVALHPLVPAEHVLEGGPASVPHVERAGDVGGRNRQRVRRPMVVRIFRGGKVPRGLPELVPARLAFGRRVLLGHLVRRFAHPTDRVRRNRGAVKPQSPTRRCNSSRIIASASSGTTSQTTRSTTSAESLSTPSTWSGVRPSVSSRSTTECDSASLTAAVACTGIDVDETTAATGSRRIRRRHGNVRAGQRCAGRHRCGRHRPRGRDR